MIFIYFVLFCLFVMVRSFGQCISWMHAWYHQKAPNEKDALEDAWALFCSVWTYTRKVMNFQSFYDL